MSQENKTWESVKQSYLEQVEAALKTAGHPQSQEILENVGLHLEQKFAELASDEQTWENFQKIIIEMGPASDYAELLGEKTIAPHAEIGIWRRFVVNAALSITIIATIIVLCQIVDRLVMPYHGKLVAINEPAKPGEFVVVTIETLQGVYVDTTNYPFVNDPNVIGKWVGVDFLKNPEEFTPGKKHWRWDLWFKAIEFFKGGTTNWGGSKWTKGLLLAVEDRTASRYIIKTIDGAQYMFFECRGGDYTILHRKPWYSVLKKETGATAADDYVQKAEQIVRLMSQKRFEAVVDSFDATMKTGLDRSKLGDVWAQLEQAGGEFKGIDGPARTERQGSMTVVFVPGKWEHNELDFKIVFSSDGKVSGLWTVAPGPRTK